MSALKIEVKDGVDVFKYPCLMEDKAGNIVWFTEPRKGTCLRATNGLSSGDHYKDLDMLPFRPTNKTICLSNA